MASVGDGSCGRVRLWGVDAGASQAGEALQQKHMGQRGKLLYLGHIKLQLPLRHQSGVQELVIVHKILALSREVWPRIINRRAT